MDTDTGMHSGKTPCGSEGRDLAEAVIRHGAPEIPEMASKLPKARGAVWSAFSLTASKGTNQPTPEP